MVEKICDTYFSKWISSKTGLNTSRASHSLPALDMKNGSYKIKRSNLVDQNASAISEDSNESSNKSTNKAINKPILQTYKPTDYEIMYIFTQLKLDEKHMHLILDITNMVEKLNE
jgi:hypothetical protein